MKSIDWNTSDKVQTAENTTGTTTSTTYTLGNRSYQAEKGWECPRCGRINAPWVRQCDCPIQNWTITTCGSYPKQDDWRTQIACEDTDTFRIHPESITYTWGKGDENHLVVGGSDYWNSVTRSWENVPHTLTITNMQKDLDEIKSTFSNTLRGE